VETALDMNHLDGAPEADPIDLGDLCKGLLMGQLPMAEPVGGAPTVITQSQAAPVRASPVRVRSPCVPEECARPPVVMTEDAPVRSPESSPVMLALADGDGSAECSPCWGGALKGDTSKCTPGFESGKAHFKNKFCAKCREGIEVPAARVRALTPELRALYNNTLSSGFWKRASPSIGGGEVRIANNTITCDGPQLIVYREEPLPQLPWEPMPDEWVTDDGIVKLSVAKGTLVPVAEMSRKQGASGPTSAPKRQRRMPNTFYPPAMPPSLRRAASAPIAQPPYASSTASSIDDERDAAMPYGDASASAPPIPATLVLPSPCSTTSSLGGLSQLSLASPATSPAQLAVRLLAAHEHVAALLEQAVKPLTPLHRQLTTEQSTSLVAQLNATRASISACMEIAKSGAPNPSV